MLPCSSAPGYGELVAGCILQQTSRSLRQNDTGIRSPRSSDRGASAYPTALHTAHTVLRKRPQWTVGLPRGWIFFVKLNLVSPQRARSGHRAELLALFSPPKPTDATNSIHHAHTRDAYPLTMPPKRTSARAAAKPAAPAVNGTTAPASKKRKAAAEEASTTATTNGGAKKRARNVDTVLEELDLNDAKRPKTTARTAKKADPKPATKPAAKPATKPAAAKSAAKQAAKPAAKRVDAVPFSAEPATTLTDFKNAPPDASGLPTVNETPTEVLTVYVFGTGDMSGDLGLGPNKKLAKRATIIPTLEPKDGTYRIVQLDCGGMHTVALTDDSRIVTWGGNDLGALGRDSNWDGGLRDMDAEAGSDSDSDDEALNPLESTPTHIPEDSFPSGTKFTCVAAGDSCSFAVTTTGLVYGWGTFQVSFFFVVSIATASANT